MTDSTLTTSFSPRPETLSYLRLLARLPWLAVPSTGHTVAG